jgi:hypothetical protein
MDIYTSFSFGFARKQLAVGVVGNVGNVGVGVVVVL